MAVIPVLPLFIALALLNSAALRALRGEPEPTRLTTDGSFKQHLHWSPDGMQFLFTRIHEGKMALWVMGADGTGLKRLLPNHTEPHFDGDWSHDGKRVVYVYDQ